MANETVQPVNSLLSIGRESRSRTTLRRDSVVNPAMEVDDAEIPKELEEELFSTTDNNGTSSVSQLQPADSADNNTSSNAAEVEETGRVIESVEEYAPQPIPNEKRDSKTEQELLVPQQHRRKYGDKRPSPPLSEQTQSTSESRQADPLPGNGAIKEVAMKDASNTASNDTTQPSNHSQMELTAPSDPAPNQSAEMPPPAAPASMLWNMTPSDTAKGSNKIVDDLFICGRLSTAVVTLFRQGKSKEAKALAQYTIDLVGAERWIEGLEEYMSVDSEPDAEEWVVPLLQDVVVVLKEIDPASSGFLNILLPFLVQR